MHLPGTKIALYGKHIRSHSGHNVLFKIVPDVAVSAGGPQATRPRFDRLKIATIFMAYKHCMYINLSHAISRLPVARDDRLTNILFVDIFAKLVSGCNSAHVPHAGGLISPPSILLRIQTVEYESMI